MALEVATYEQILTILTQLATNYTNLFDVYYDMFYNQTPKDLALQIYDEEGNLNVVAIPNRAKDRTYILNGNGNPNGSVGAAKGSTYQDLTNGEYYLNLDGSTTGWTKLIAKANLDEIIMQGGINPEGAVTAGKGTLYSDTQNGVLYIKTTSTGNTGWINVSADIGNTANTDLSNLSSIGEAHFANPSLSNLSSAGQTIIDSKENVSNKAATITGSDTSYPTSGAVYRFVTDGLALKENLSNKVATLNASSTDAQYPSAKLVYDSLNLKEDKANKVTTVSASSTDTQYPSAKSVYDFGRLLVPSQPETRTKVLSSNGTNNTWLDFYDYFTSLPSSGNINLVTNSLNYISPAGAVTFVLPDVSTSSILNQILVQIDLSTVYSINVGTIHFFNGKTPDLSTTGSYNLIYEYDEIKNVWVCGWMRKS